MIDLLNLAVILQFDLFFSRLWDLLRASQQPLGAVVATLTIFGFVFKIFPLIKDKLAARWVIKHLPQTMGAGLYTPQEIARATQFYIESNCQSVDPSGGEDFRHVYGAREPAFKALDNLLFSEVRYRHTLILADAGMGKSSLFLNYYARHIRNKSRMKHFQIGIIPLGIPDVSERIDKFTDRSKTVIFLDALDEDTLAVQDHKKRLADLIQWTRGFRHVVITCRTQFFMSDEEIPKDAGIVRIGITKAGESHHYSLNKLYLSPFSDAQIDKFLKKKFKNRKQYRDSRKIAIQLGDLSARPMLLAHIDDLLSQKRKFEYSFQIYEEMVEAWFKREERFVSKDLLREFCELVAIDVYKNRETRHSEKISYAELAEIANQVSPEIVQWKDSERSQLANRSLLNRDAEGNRKFSHRSIMEYLFVARAARCLERNIVPQWTDQMEKFWEEMIFQSLEMFHHTSSEPPHKIIKGLLRLDMPLDSLQDTMSEFKNSTFANLMASHPLSILEKDIAGIGAISIYHIRDSKLSWFFISLDQSPLLDADRRSFVFTDESGAGIIKMPTVGEASLIYLATAVQLGYSVKDIECIKNHSVKNELMTFHFGDFHNFETTELQSHVYVIEWRELAPYGDPKNS